MEDDMRRNAEEEEARRLAEDAEAELLKIVEEMEAQNRLKQDVSYGATDGLPLKHDGKRGGNLNLSAATLAICIPWFVFCIVAAAWSFHLRQAWFAAIHVAGFATVCVCAGLAHVQWQRRRSGDQGYDPAMYMFLAATSFLAVCLALAFGGYVWWSNMSRYWEYASLNEYSNVNPVQMSGSQVMDAGSVKFVEGSRLDTSKSIAFNQQNMYCVAPIVMGGDQPAAYDFWAVGTNCCTGDSSRFQCGDWSNKQAREGMRVMEAGDEELYKLAVLRAQAHYKINVTHPLFFHWTRDANGDIQSMYSQGKSEYVVSIFAFLFILCFLFVSFQVRLESDAANLEQALEV